MKKIIIGFSSHKSGIMSWLIRKVEGTPYSHTYIKFHSDSFDRTLIYQASGLLVNFMSEAIFLDQNNVVEEFEFDVPECVYKKVIQFAIDNAGKPYSIQSLFGIAYIKLMKAFGKHVRNPFTDGEKSYVCSELVSTIIEHFLEKDFGENLDDVSPKDLHNYMMIIQLKQLSQDKTLENK